MNENPKSLKTMNDISLADAISLFTMYQHQNSPELDFLFTQDELNAKIALSDTIAARDFLECLDMYRKWHYGDERHVFVHDFEEQLAEQIEAAAEVSDQDLEKLSPSEKEVYLLYKNERLSYKEIATRLSKSRETVHGQLKSARRKLHPRRTSKGQDYEY